MPANPDKSQGQSAGTIDKERRIGSALSLGMRLASVSKLQRYPYWHFDANAGDGWNDLVGVPGTPLVFWNLADLLLSGRKVNAFFSELELPRTRRLLERFGDNPRWDANSHIMPGDNAEGIEVFAQVLSGCGENPAYLVGSVVVDPNGYFYRNQSGQGAPVEQLLAFAATYPRVDMILNLNIRTYLMQRAHSHGVLPPRTIFEALRRKHWVIAMTNVGNGTFLLAVGRNLVTGGHRALGMHDIASPEGQHILSVVEGARQPRLFG